MAAALLGVFAVSSAADRPYACSFVNGSLCGMMLENRWQITRLFTPSGSTGPNRGPSGLDSDYYAFLETSDGNPNHTHAESLLTTPQFTPVNNGSVAFMYHMYGSHIGTLTVLSSDDGGEYTPIFDVAGQQQTSASEEWNFAVIHLPENTTSIQFRGSCGGGLDNETCGNFTCQQTCTAGYDRDSCPCGGWYGDIAIDEIVVTDNGEIPERPVSLPPSIATPAPTGPCCRALEVTSDFTAAVGIYTATSDSDQPNYTTPSGDKCFHLDTNGFWAIGSECTRNVRPFAYHPGREACPVATHGWQTRSDLGGPFTPTELSVVCTQATQSPTIPPPTVPLPPTTAAPTQYVPEACRAHLSVNCSGPHSTVQMCRNCAFNNNPGAAVCRFRHRNAYCDNPSTREPTTASPTTTSPTTTSPTTASPTTTSPTTASPTTTSPTPSNRQLQSKSDKGFLSISNQLSSTTIIVCGIAIFAILAVGIYFARKRGTKRNTAPEPTPRLVENPLYNIV